MKHNLSGFSRIYICLVFSILVGCSPSAPPSTEEQASESGDIATENPDQAMFDDGWRKGILKIEVEIHQIGNAHEKGNAELTSDWETIITATSEQQVLIVKDLRAIVADEPNEEARQTALTFEPYFISETFPEAKISGKVAHKAHFVLSDPDSVDLTSSVHDIEESGVVENLRVQSMHPSLFGKGYEVSVDLDLKDQRKLTEKTQLRTSSDPIVKVEEKEVVEPISLMLYPVPNKDKLNDYPYLPEMADEELKTELNKQQVELLSLINQLYADSFPVQSQMRAGMLTEATKDALTLTYEYTGDKQLAFIASLESLAGKISPNLLRIKITLQAAK